VRVLCKQCKETKELSPTQKEEVQKFLSTLSARVDKTPYANPIMCVPKGCTACGGLGYRGRTSIFELFEITNDIQDAIFHNPSALELFTLAKKQGMVTMQEDGILKVILGITSVDEVQRTTGVVPWLTLDNKDGK
jgi:type II secretory ATPase GspE/PulE/Tfp pilus assembly ATPase PilB-like protein